jgi:hypothetical protein
MGNVISTVIDRKDLPLEFLEEWTSMNSVDSVASISDVELDETSFKHMQTQIQNMCKNCINADLICDNDCGTIMCDTCEKEWYYENNIKKLGHNPKCGDDTSQDDSDCDRVDPDTDVLFTKEEEEGIIFNSEDEETDEENEVGEPIVDLDSDSSDPDTDRDTDIDETICTPDCDCINCEEERREVRKDARTSSVGASLLSHPLELPLD